MGWGEDGEELGGMRNERGREVGMMEWRGRYKRIERGVIYWGGMGGNGGEFGWEEWFYRLVEEGVWVFGGERN